MLLEPTWNVRTFILYALGIVNTDILLYSQLNFVKFDSTFIWYAFGVVSSNIFNIVG
jgi:hypothetical protein